MFTDKKNVAIAALAAVLIIAVILLGKFAYEEHKVLDAAMTADSADRATIKQYEADRSALAAADVAQQKAAQVTESKIKTSNDAVRTIVQYVPVQAAAVAPGAPAAPPQTAAIPKADLTAAGQAAVPDSPSYVIQTQDAAVATAKTLVQCKADQSSLSTCTKQISDLVVERDAYKADAETWEKTAKGGSKAKRILKFTACAAVSGGAAYAGSLSKQPKYAALGAIGGFTACQLLF